MTVTTTLRQLLLPELEAEFANTRKMLANIPDGNTAFKAHERSMPLSTLAGHTAIMPGYISLILGTPSVDMAATPLESLTMLTTAQILADFDHLADAAITALKGASDQTFEQEWVLSAGPTKIFSGTRYMAYRLLGVNHMVHHRAQLGLYLRLLGAPVPSVYGPSADEPLD